MSKKPRKPVPQLSLFGKHMPRFARDSETSRQAAVSMYDHAGEQARQVLSYVASCGANGATCDEVERHLGLPHQSASARVNWLKDGVRKLIVDSGRTRATRSGRQATVWVTP